MLHNGNRINGHSRSEQSIKLLREHLVTLHEDGDGDSLSVRFSELLNRVVDMECSMEATWKCYLRTAEQLKLLKDKYHEP
jgi:hypothetical protein